MITTDFAPITGPGLTGFSFPTDTALFVIGDVHGQADALKSLCAGINDLDTGSRKRHVVVLGDLIDRGPASIESLDIAVNQITDLTRADDVTILPGNHELLLASAINECLSPDSGNRATSIWLANGGIKVLAEAFKNTAEAEHLAEALDLLPYVRSHYEVFALLAPIMPKMPDLMQKFLAILQTRGLDFVSFVQDMPSHLMVGSVLCVHAGVNPKLPLDTSLGYSKEDHMTVDDHWAWVRDPFLMNQQGWFKDGWKNWDAAADSNGLLVVHGHTVPKKWAKHASTDTDRIARIFDRTNTNARICVDFGAALGKGVGGCLLTDQGRKLMFQPCVAE